VARMQLPDGVSLLTTLPVCARTDDGQTIAALMRLDAARAGAKLSDIKLSRLPSWFNCERSLTDGTELPLAPGELRVLTEQSAIERLRDGVLGVGASCRRFDGQVLCARDIALTGGTAVADLPALPVLTPGQSLEGLAVGPVLSFGWQADSATVDFLSEGPRSTLLARVPAPTARMILHLTLAGIARKVGENRPIVIQVGGGRPVDVDLVDLAPTDISLPVAGSDLSNGILRVAIDIFRPVDPKRRGLVLPVNRAGIRIERVELSAAAS